MPRIDAHMGPIGGGKDYQAKLLIQKDPNYVQIDFKDALIDMCEDIIGFPIRARYEEFKEYIIGFQHPNAKLAGLLQRDSQMLFNKQCVADYPMAMTGRRLLQRVGTDVMRKRDPDYWTTAWAQSAIAALQAGKNVCVGDCRFLNEMHIVETLGEQMGIETHIIFCDYHSKRYDSTSPHESERLAQRLLKYGCIDLQQICHAEGLLACEKDIVGAQGM
jgi:hypothetical protein